LPAGRQGIDLGFGYRLTCSHDRSGNQPLVSILHSALDRALPATFLPDKVVRVRKSLSSFKLLSRQGVLWTLAMTLFPVDMQKAETT